MDANSISINAWLVPALLSVIILLLAGAFNRFGSRLEKQEEKSDNLETRVDNHEVRITKLEDK